MTAIQEFQKLLTEEGIHYFSAAEVFFRGGSDERLRLNTDPPRELWPNIIPALKVLDIAREKLGEPLRLTSIYRAPAYNLAIGGEKGSYHQHFVACDVQSDRVSARGIYRVLADMRAEHAFVGGLGKYPSFVHVDTRGYNATW